MWYLHIFNDLSSFLLHTSSAHRFKTFCILCSVYTFNSITNTMQLCSISVFVCLTKYIFKNRQLFWFQFKLFSGWNLIKIYILLYIVSIFLHLCILFLMLYKSSSLVKYLNYSLGSCIVQFKEMLFYMLNLLNNIQNVRSDSYFRISKLKGSVYFPF